MMSQDELRQQHDTINTIAKQVATIIKWWPLVAGVGSLVIAIGTLAIAGYKYDDNLVKKGEYAKMIKAVECIASGQIKDSVVISNGLIAVNRRVDSLADSKPKRKRGYGIDGFTETKDKNGAITLNKSNRLN